MKDRDSLGVTDIKVGNISVQAIDEMLKDVLGEQTVSDTLELATVIHNKTEGNPFFTLQFWYLLYEDGMVRRNGSTDTWEWDLDEIRVFAHTIKDIVDLMQTKFKTLSLHIQNLLWLSACLGTLLRVDVLEVVTSKDSLRSFFGSEAKSSLIKEVSVASESVFISYPDWLCIFKRFECQICG